MDMYEYDIFLIQPYSFDLCLRCQRPHSPLTLAFTLLLNSFLERREPSLNFRFFASAEKTLRVNSSVSRPTISSPLTLDAIVKSSSEIV